MLPCKMRFRSYIAITHISAGHGQPSLPTASTPISTTAPPVYALRGSPVRFQLVRWKSFHIFLYCPLVLRRVDPRSMVAQETFNLWLKLECFLCRIL